MISFEVDATCLPPLIFILAALVGCFWIVAGDNIRRYFKQALIKWFRHD